MSKTCFRILLGVSLIMIPSISDCQKIPILRLEDAYNKQQSINSNEFISSIEYISLETSPDCLIGANPNIYVTEKYFLVTDNQNHCFLFDKFSGKFIREIGHYGKDPGGFRSNKGFFNELTSTIFFNGWSGQLLKYSLDGKYLGAVSIPNYNDGFTNTYIPDRFEYLDDKHFLCNIINTDGLQKTLLLVLDDSGKEIKIIPNKKPLIKHNLTVSTGDVHYFHYGKKLYFNEYCNDTIFNVSLKGTQPYMIIDRGKLIPTRENRTKANNIIQAVSFFESDRFFMINLWIRGNDDNIALYNKVTSSLKTCNFKSEFKNNTDGFVPFLPKAIHNNELIGIIQQQDIVLWAENNQTLRNKLPETLKKLALKDPTDNPTIAIAKLK